MSKQSQTTEHETYGLEGTHDAVDGRREASSLHDHHEGSNDHLASVYEGKDEQFDAVVPFIRAGLERGERCLYVADDNAEEEVVRALREGGIDVDAARERGALSIHSKDDTYVRTGEFDRDAMLEYWETSLSEARDVQDFTGVRAAAEMTWAIEEGTSLDLLVEYEAMLNTLYSGEDYVVLCQYNRDRFPSDVIANVIRTHPFVVYDGTVCRNFYYHSPEEFFGTEHPPMDVERTMDGLVSRARSRHALREREEQLRARLRQQAVVADLSQQALELSDLDALFADVTERVADTLDAEYCEVLELNAYREDLLLREGVGWDHGTVGEATVPADRDSPAGYALRTDEPVIVEDLSAETRFTGSDLLVDRDVTSGISVIIGQRADPWGVLGVHTCDRREFSSHDATFVRSVANTVATAIDRAQRERYQRDLYGVTSCPDRSFEEKLQALFDLGCERFDLDLGGMGRIDPGSDLFEVEYVSDDHEHIEPGARVELSETYCRVHTDDGGPTGITDPREHDLHGTTAHDEFGVRSYLGTRISLVDELDRTLFFVSSERRSKEFSQNERTFCNLMGQWVEHELERRQYQRRLEQSNQRLEQFAYAASHDLQEPLRMVSSYLQLVERRYQDELDADGREFIDYAVDGADRMRDMIDGLLDYSRVETRGDPLVPVDLSDVLDDVLADLHLQIEDSDAEITADDLPHVEGDGNQLRQLLQNLLDNAMEYSGEDPPRIHVTADPCGDEWLIAVRDEGIGIDLADADRVFEVFQRLHTQDEHSGIGIGLALCERIVDRHGGDIWIESEPGVGSTVSFTLPDASESES